MKETLSRACTDVQPEEWVTFAFTRRSVSGLTEMTSGAWYVRGPLVHLRLANYRIAVTLPGLQKVIWENPTRPQGEGFYELVPRKHQQLMSETHISPFQSTSADFAMDYLPLLMKETAGSTSSKPADERPVPSASVEERLNTLKRLREQSLITEEEYRAKKQQILDRL